MKPLVAVLLLILFKSLKVTGNDGEIPKINNDHLELLQKISDNIDASMVEKKNNHQKMIETSTSRKNELKGELARRFEEVLKEDKQRHDQLTATLKRILDSVEPFDALNLSHKHVELIANISKKIETSRFEDKEDFNALEKLYVQQHLELKKETDTRVEALNKKRTEQVEELKEMIQTVLRRISDPYENCYSIYVSGTRISGVYSILPKGMNSSFPAYCDMESDGGGWTVIQRRGEFKEGAVSFNRTWNEYKEGFGNLHGEFWLGNEKIHLLTKNVKFMLRIMVRDYQNNWLERAYNSFYVTSEQDSYRLSISTPTSGSTSDPFYELRSEKFATYDRNPQCSNGAGWWYYNCKATTHLNGPRRNVDGKFGVTFDGSTPVAFSVMEIKPRTE